MHVATRARSRGCKRPCGRASRRARSAAVGGPECGAAARGSAPAASALSPLRRRAHSVRPLPAGEPSRLAAAALLAGPPLGACAQGLGRFGCGSPHAFAEQRLAALAPGAVDAPSESSGSRRPGRRSSPARVSDREGATPCPRQHPDGRCESGRLEVAVAGSVKRKRAGWGGGERRQPRAGGRLRQTERHFRH